jgi:hypothetical protein
MSTSSTRARDPAHTARLQFDALQLKSALALFEQAKRETGIGFYRERVEINLVYQKWHEALSLALKSGKADAIFVSAVAAAEFDVAAEQIRAIRAQLVSGSGTKDALASVYDLIHLVIYVSLATGSTADVANMVEAIRGARTFDVPQLWDFAELFARRDFRTFRGKLKEWRRRFKLSYYANASKDSLEDAIQRNVVRNAAEPYGNVTISQLAGMVSCDEGFVVTSLRWLIRKGKLQGSLDLAAGRFHGGGNAAEYLELLDVLDRTVIVKERYAKVTWQIDYGEKITQIRRARGDD